MPLSRRVRTAAFWVSTVCALALLDRPTITTAQSAQRGHRLLGGAHGAVRGQDGEPLEGVGVQLISQKTAIRTTVYTNESGRYEFPPLEAGAYTLRVPRPLEFRPYVKESVRVDKAIALDEIRLERVSPTEFLPPTPDILAQLTGSEWMMNLPGSGEEKRMFTLGCGMGCHSYQQVFRNRYDERSWQLILQRMLRSGSSTLINDVVPTSETMSRAGRPMLEVEAFLAKWLGRVRGPDFEDPPLHYLPRERGRATRVIVTEYELPRELLAPHDVHGDAKGNIWYTAHRSAYSGVLDPRTGAVKEYRIPEKERDTSGFLPGTHRVWVHTDGMVWFWEAWDGSLTALDPRTGEITKRWDEVGASPEAPGGIGGPNFAMDEAGYIYQTYRGTVVKTDSRTGEIVSRFPLKEVQGTYDSIITPDGRYWAGGVGPTDSYRRLLGLLDTKTGEVWEPKTSEITSPSRGGFDAQGNAWFGGRGGMLLKLDAKTKRVAKYYPPIPFETYYEAMPDKNGEVWAGGLQSGRFWRFNPKTELWTGYMMPEPYAHDRRTWIDNSTSPVTVWYVDHNGYMVRIQPLE